MKKFLFQILLFLSLIVIFDFCYGRVCTYLRANAHGGDTKVNKLITDSIKSDILIFGSSRAHSTFFPPIIADSLGMSCFNCGASGMGIIYHYGMWKIITKRYYPKVIIYEVLPVLDEMSRDDNIIFVNNLRPYYDVNGVDSIFWDFGSNERIKMLSNTYIYHNQLGTLYRDYRNKQYSHDGFAPMDKRYSGDDKFSIKTDYVPDTLKLKYLEKFIRDTRGHTKLVFIASPRYRYYNEGNAFAPLRRLCEKYDVPFLDYYCDKKFIYRKECYADQTHFNLFGAKIYTKYIVKYIREIIK